MVFFTLAEFFVEASIWTARKSFSLGYWLIYGTPKSKEQLLLEHIIDEQKEIISEERKNIQELRKSIDELEEKINNQTFLRGESSGNI